jgi:hypothetical protein
MANTGLWEVQKTLVSTLTSSTTLSSLVSTIIDEPETNETYPYITIGNGTELTDNTLRRLGFNNTLTFFIYTKPYGLGWYTAYTILDAMNEVLNIQKPTMDNLNLLFCKLDNIIQEKEGDKRILHVRYRVWSQQKALHTII